MSEENRSRHKESEKTAAVVKPVVAKALNDQIYDEPTQPQQPVVNFRKQSLASAQRDVEQQQQHQLASNVKELDDYVLIFNKPQKDSGANTSNTIPIPQSETT